MRYLLDTNIVSELISKKPNENVLNFLNTLSEEDVLLSVLTVGEIKSGIENLQDSVKKETLTLWLNNDLLNRFKNRLLDIDLNIMLVWGEIIQKNKKIGSPLPIIDSLIGATCIVNNLTLVTRNESDFKNLDINIINPFL
ncbi:type II toxin-antitoxin system VapC family toxin [Arcobacter sp. FWKO B]|uniref:type II toxin-antitoxin system VapC family toxin n=1 Tax=Arcobacter sp. FWKO B TaxID=2593672 RepID=UPI001905E341|nr:type II toxin-antitoxin system VapC family toxin [Arcobacter sp. FWKO B]